MITAQLSNLRNFLSYKSLQKITTKISEFSWKLFNARPSKMQNYWNEMFEYFVK